MFRTDQDNFGDRYNDMWGQKGWFKPSCVPISIILVLIVLVVLLPLLDAAEKRTINQIPHTLCYENCSFTLIETIPEGLKYNESSPSFPSTFAVWKEMINGAKRSIEIASFYWTLRAADGLTENFPGTEKGAEIFEALIAAGRDRGIKLKIVQSQPSKSFPNLETEVLTNKGHAEVRNVNMVRLVGNGVLHTKLWIVDREELYVGSANTDWRSLSQVKELGLRIKNCSCLLEDMGKIFDVYWAMGVPNASLPAKWPESLSTNFNRGNPILTKINDSVGTVYLSSSPPEFCTNGRTNDLQSILDVIQKAEEFVYISVMDYIPLMIYTHKTEFWPYIDNALKEVAINKRVELRLLISKWPQTRYSEIRLLKSLSYLDGISKDVVVKIKLFIVPADAEQKKIPHARVNHNKYMVTDRDAYIGTSNWAGDYFVNTAGIGVITGGNTTLREHLESIFLRDWNSAYAHPLWEKKEIV